MKIRNFENEPEFKHIPTIEKSAELLKTEHSHIIYMSLKPGDFIKKHSAEMDVSFFLAEGIVDMEMGDKTERITAGTLVAGDKVDLHGFANYYSENAKMLVIKHLTTK